MLVGIYVTSSFSDPFSLNPDPAKNLNPADPDPSYSLTLPGNDKKCVFFCISLFNCLSFPFQFWYSILTEETNFLLFFFHFWYCRFVFVFNIYLQFLNLNDIALTNFAYSIFCLPLIGLPHTLSCIGAHPWPCSIRILLFFGENLGIFHVQKSRFVNKL